MLAKHLMWIILLSTLAATLMTYAETLSVPIRVAAPAGPPPLGAPVETSVPFAAGALKEAGGLAVVSPENKAVMAQFRPAMRWPDGSIRWLFVVFEAEAGPGLYRLTQGTTPSAPALVKENGEGASVDSVFVITTPDGTVFRAPLAPNAEKPIIEENGPVRASIRYEGRCQSEKGQPLFDFIARWQVYRNRSQRILTLTWLNATDAPGERVRDMRVNLPYDFAPNRIIAGAERGVYDAPWMKDNVYWVLQEDHDWYWARRLHTDGRVLHMATGGANGRRCPGWLYVRDDQRCFGAYVPRFREEYPNDIQVKAGELSIGLWPERANAHLSSKPILPPNENPDPKLRYRRPQYWPLMPHPYLAFFSPEDKCLDVPQGLAKTQTIILDADLSFEKKHWLRALEPARGTVSPAPVAQSLALGPLWPADKERFPEAERTFDEAFDWFVRHIDELECYGKFDYGDFKYFTPSTTYLTETGKWASMQEMPREGYWHNNERDTLRGLLLHYLRTGNPKAYELAAIAARHALDVDIQHKPVWGMYTHAYGHCYRAGGNGGASDHAWLLGLLEWAGVSGDPVVWDWMMKCGEQLVRVRADFSKTDARTTSLHLHMMITYYRYTGDKRYAEAAKAPAEALMKTQRPDGSWSKYLAKPNDPAGFVDHVILAAADYYGATKDERMLPVITKSLEWYLPKNADECAGMTSDAPLIMIGLDAAWRATRDPRYVEWAKKVYARLDKSQNRSPDPIGRGDFWAGWGANEPEKSAGMGRPPQFTDQTRPLGPSTMLAYGPMAMKCIAEAAGWKMPESR